MTKPTARNLFLIVVSILTLDIFRSVRFAHRHALTKLSDTSLNAYYYALKTDRPNHEAWRDVTLSKALKVVPGQLTAQPLFLSIDDAMVEKKGEKFELRSKLFDHAAHDGSNYLRSSTRLATNPFGCQLSQSRNACLFEPMLSMALRTISAAISCFVCFLSQSRQPSGTDR